MGLTRYPKGDAVFSCASGAPRLPAEAARVIEPTDWALSSCLSFPSGSPLVVTAVRLKSILASAAVTSGWTAAETDPDGVPASVAMTGPVAGTVTVRTRPVAARAMPAFCPTPLAAAKSVTWRNGLRRPLRSSRCASRGRSAITATAGRGSGAGPVARRRPLAVWVVKNGSSLESLRS